MRLLRDTSHTTHLIPGLMKRFSVGALLASWYLPRITKDRFWLALDHFSVISRDRLLALALTLDPWLTGTVNLHSANIFDQYAETSVTILVNGRIINNLEVLSRRIFGTGWRP